MESIESFLRQVYDGKKELIIVNDYPRQKLIFDHPEVRIINLNKTFKSIGEKERFAFEQCSHDTVVQWDDDDIALPWHLENINKYFPGHHLLHWNRGIFMNAGKIAAIRNIGNSGIVFSKSFLEGIGGYVKGQAGADMDTVKLIRENIIETIS